MRIALELGLNADAPRGADVYFHGLVRGLSQLEERHKYVLFTFFYNDFERKLRALPRPAGPQFELAYKRWPERLVRPLENAGLPAIDRLFARPAKIELYHCLGGRPPRLGVPTVLTVYDLLPEVLHEKGLAPKALPSGARFAGRADRVIAISAATRNDLIRHYGVEPGKVDVVHLGVDHDLFKPVRDRLALADCRRRYKLPERYLLFVGPFESRRNAEAGLRALAGLREAGVAKDCGAVLVGNENAYASSLKSLARSLGLEKDAVFTGFVPREDLPLIYAQAFAFVHPEHYDGFSLQLLEAMACGLPALISDAPALTEIAAGAAVISRTGAREVERELARLFKERRLPALLSARSLARASVFSWKRTAQQTVGIYEALAAKASGKN